MEKQDNSKKYFNPEEYITKIIGREAEDIGAKENNKIKNLIDLLTNPEHKNVKEEALLTLKKDKGEQLLLLAIATPEAKENKAKLIAACWESEINFSKYLPFFILLAMDTDYLVSLEAITVISTMEGPFEKEHLADGIKKIKAAKSEATTERVVLLNDLLVTLEDLQRNTAV